VLGARQVGKTCLLRYLHDHYPDLKFIVSGSSSLKLRFRMAEPLTILYPLSFIEFLDFTERNELKEILLNSKTKPIPEPFLSQISTVYIWRLSKGCAHSISRNEETSN